MCIHYKFKPHKLCNFNKINFFQKPRISDKLQQYYKVASASACFFDRYITNRLQKLQACCEKALVLL